MEGSILLHRKLLESYVFANDKDLKIWIWLLLKARYKTGFAKINIGKSERTIPLKRGQLIFGRHAAQEALDIPGNTIVRHLERMKAEKMIVIDVGSQYSVITICNYDSYQANEAKDEQATGRQRAGNGQATGTNNKDNKVNKEEQPALPHGVEFFKIWEQWIKYRKEIKKPLSETSIKKQIEFLTNRSEAEAIASLNKSMMNNWQGIFEDKTQVVKQLYPVTKEPTEAEKAAKLQKQLEKYKT